jgi:hypothetical protein
MAVWQYKVELIPKKTLASKYGIIPSFLVAKILVLARKWETLLLDEKGKLFEPYFPEVIKSIKDSKSFLFIQNPLKFLDSS